MSAAVIINFPATEAPRLAPKGGAEDSSGRLPASDRRAPSNGKPVNSAVRHLQLHWPEYLMEAAGLGIFMVSACFFTALLEYPGSPVRQVIESAVVRRSIVGAAMGLTAIGIIYSPWGKQSGAHINPAVTLTFLRLSRMAPWDAFFYVTSQFAGALVGVLLSWLVLGDILSDASVNYVVTVPGQGRVALAFVAEFAISFGLMLTVLVTSNRPRVASLTGMAAGLLVAIYIIVEGPLSGMSMNPARTFGSALPAHVWTSFWLYVAAPTLAMLLAAQSYVKFSRHEAFCAKLHHENRQRCIHCEYRARRNGLLEHEAQPLGGVDTSSVREADS